MLFRLFQIQGSLVPRANSSHLLQPFQNLTQYRGSKSYSQLRVLTPHNIIINKAGGISGPPPCKTIRYHSDAQRRRALIRSRKNRY